MKIVANSIRAGNILVFEGQLWSVVKMPEHTKPGKGGAYVQVEMKNLQTGNKMHTRISSNDHVEKAFLEQKDFIYLYEDENHFIFMDNETFDQIHLDSTILKDKKKFLIENLNVTIEFFEDKPINIELPNTVNLKVEETDPTIKGATVTSSYKPAILENNLRVMVPPYIETGEVIVVKTEDGTFVERAK